MIGLDYADTARYLKGKYNLEGTVEFLVEQQKVNAVKRIDRGLIPLPFIPQLIDALLSHQLPLGLASNSPRVYVEHALSSLGFKEKFSCVYARDDLNNGKPDPEPYLAACACLGADPASSLAVEDSLVGAQSAAAAGMTVAMVCPVPPEEIPPSFTRLVWFPDAASLYSALFPVQ